jgi:IPT/TIG domain
VVVKKNVLLALGALAVIVIAATGGLAAHAADPGIVEINADLVHPAGFGHLSGDVRKIPRGNKVVGDDDARPAPKEPDDAPPGRTASDPALQGAGTTSSAPTSGGNFAGLSHDPWGAGWPPDPNGDVGPSYYVQVVNTSVGIFDKSTGAQAAVMTFDDLIDGTGTPCDTANQGDPVALYDPIGDRYIVSDFAWTNFSTGPFYQCFAVSKTNDPVTGGWWFYAWQTEVGSLLPDYPKLGVWPDGIYMSANVFATTGSQSFKNVQVWAFNRQQMEAGNPSPQALTANLPGTSGGVTVFSLLPSNARSVTGLPPAGAPNYFASIWGTYAIRVWKFHVDWTTPSSSTFTGPTNVPIAAFNVGPSDVPELQGNNLDTLTYRLMMQNQYTNLNGRESLWLTHTVGSGGTGNVAQVRWYELPVTGGTIASSPRQQATWSPDAKNRFMPSLAVDKSGDMAIGYSVSDGSMYPAIRYSGRLANDTLSQLTQGETTLVQGQGFQCCTFSDGSTNNRWGDYSAMTIDPDGCTFWYTNEYYDAHPTTKAEDNWLTRIGSFQLPGCGSVTPPAAPSISGFNPSSGPVGTSVTINGSGFTGTTSVTFNGAAAPFSIVSDAQLTATVPAGATTGPIGVAAPGGSTTSATSFTVTPAAPAPAISSISPTSGKAGTQVTINGSGLTGTTSVAFGGGRAASFTVVSDVQVRTTVPNGAKTGPIRLTTPGGSASSQTFTVTKH